MEKEYSRREFLKTLSVAGAYLGVASVPLISILGCGAATFDNIKTNPARSRKNVTLGHYDFQLSRNKIYFHVDKLKIPRIIIDPYESQIPIKGNRKGRNLFYFKNILEIVPPVGSKRIRTRKELERVIRDEYYKAHEIATTVSPRSKEEIIAGYYYEGRDPDPFDIYSSQLEAERLSRTKIKTKIKYIKRREGGGGNGGTGGNGGNGGGVGGGGGSGGSAGG